MAWQSPRLRYFFGSVLLILGIIIFIIIPSKPIDDSYSSTEEQSPLNEDCIINDNASEATGKSTYSLTPPIAPPLKTGEFSKYDPDIQFKFALAKIAAFYSRHSGYIPTTKDKVKKDFVGIKELENNLVFKWERESAGFVSLENEGFTFVLRLKKNKREIREYRLIEKNGMITVTRIDTNPERVVLKLPSLDDSESMYTSRDVEK